MLNQLLRAKTAQGSLTHFVHGSVVFVGSLVCSAFLEGVLAFLHQIL